MRTQSIVEGREKIVLYVYSGINSLGGEAENRKLAGAQRIAERRHWNLQRIGSKLTDAKLKDIISFWQPAGVIVECGDTDFRPPVSLFGHIPVVFIDYNPSELTKSGFNIKHDSVITGEMAAKELMMARVESFAYIPNPRQDTFWSREREAGFRHALELNGISEVAVFRSSIKDMHSPTYLKELGAFLRKLHKPCGIFLSNDLQAGPVMARCAIEGFSIPNDVAMVGVDDNVEICEALSPTLTSILLDFDRAGELAALMLAAKMRDGAAYRGEHTRIYGNVRLVRRMSTLRLGGRTTAQIARAMELIRKRACLGLKAEEVLSVMDDGRTMAAAAFREFTGHSVLEEIHIVRLARIKELLENPNCQLSLLHTKCGFNSANSMRKFFRRETGMTLTAWRKKGAKTA